MPFKTRQTSDQHALVVPTTDGAPTDADFDTPVDGMVVVDTTNGSLYFRSGDAWTAVTNVV